MTLNVMMDKWGPATRSSVGTFIYMKQWIEERSRRHPFEPLLQYQNTFFLPSS